MLSFLLQAAGTFKFPDLFPNQDVKAQESAQKEADTPPEEPEPLRWFWRQEALQELIHEVSYQSLASLEWHWSEENGTVWSSCIQAVAQSLLCYLGSKGAGLDEHWSVEFGAGHWLRRVQTRKKKRSIFWTETFSSHVYIKKLQGVFYLGKTICGTAGFHFDVWCVLMPVGKTT